MCWPYKLRPLILVTWIILPVACLSEKETHTFPLRKCCPADSLLSGSAVHLSGTFSCLRLTRTDHDKKILESLSNVPLTASEESTRPLAVHGSSGTAMPAYRRPTPMALRAFLDHIVGGDAEEVRDFCLDHLLDPNEDEASLVVLMCEDGDGRTRLRNCCPNSYFGVLARDRFSCVKSHAATMGSRWQPHDSFGMHWDQEDFQLMHDSDLAEADLECLVAHEQSEDQRNFSMFVNGSVQMIYGLQTTHTLSPREFCLALDDWRPPVNASKAHLYLLCSDTGSNGDGDGEDDDAAGSFVPLSYLICSSISNVFLLITFCVYLILPDLRRPLFGKIIMSFILSLGLAYVFLSVTTYASKALMDDDGTVKNAACQLLGFVSLYFFLHTFFWMNVLCYDIYRKFTRFRQPLAQSEEQLDRVRFLKYIVYASGVPVIVTLVTLVVELLPQSYGNVIRPGFGKKNCFFYTPLANFLYFHLYVLVIQLANMTFFVLTIVHLYRTWHSSKKMGQQHTGGGKKRRKSKENFKVIAKLFVVMGVTWMSEFVSFLFRWIFDGDDIWKYFVVNDVINVSQGILIFVVLVCKRSVLEKLKQRLLPGGFTEGSSTATGSDAKRQSSRFGGSSASYHERQDERIHGRPPDVTTVETSVVAFQAWTPPYLRHPRRHASVVELPALQKSEKPGD